MVALAASGSTAEADDGGMDRPIAGGTRPRSAARWAPLGLAAVLFVVALGPRLADVDRFVTTDELFWVGRTGNFARALATGQLAQTFQTGHPGVTTMWTALVGIGTSRAQELAGERREVSRRAVSEHPSFLPSLASARRALGVATAAGIALIVLLAWRLFGPGPAALGGALLALDPFILAHSRLVHIDASLAIWTNLAVLAMLTRWTGGGSATLLLSGVAMGLALLSKAPAAYALVFAPVSAAIVRGPEAFRSGRTWRDLALWVGLVGLVYVTLWPALWVAPGHTLGQVLGFVRDNANPSHAAAADPGTGPLFYALVLALRSTPLTWLGLAALVLLRPTGPAGRVALVLGLFALGFAVAMTVAAKNFDRYLLPAFSALDLLAGFGLWQLVVRVAPGGIRAGAGAAAAATIVALSSVWLAGSWPYVLTYANPAAGGPVAAHALVASGWGEGLDQVAAHLNGKPDADRLKVGMPGEIYTTVLGAQLRGQVAPAEGADAGAYDYVVVYTRNLQLGERPPFLDQRFLRWRPEATISLGGVEYAWIYNSVLGTPIGAEFGGALALAGYGLDAATVRAGRSLELRLRWRPLAALPPDLRLLVELRPAGARDATAAQLVPLQPVDAGTWRPGAIAQAAYSVPAQVEPGSYVLAVRVVDASDRPLGLTRSPPYGPEAAAESDAVALRGLQVR